MTFRIKFAKYGVVRFIGHLDVMRYFQKVIRRSGLPVSYSQGFSPHQLMSFALPLSVGVTSDGEYMEVEFEEDKLVEAAARNMLPGDLTDGSKTELMDELSVGSKTALSGELSDGVRADTTADTTLKSQADMKYILEKYIFEGLSANTTEGFAIFGVEQLPKPEPNKHVDKAMALVSAADYMISIKDGYEDAVGFASQDELIGEFEKFIGQEMIEVTKKTKKNENRLNLKEFIYGYGDEKFLSNGTNSCDISAAGAGIAHARRFRNGMHLILRLAAGSRMNIKPEMVLEAFLGSLGREYDENAFATHRIELFMGEPGNLRPLIG